MVRQVLLICDHCARPTDLLAELADSGAWAEDRNSPGVYAPEFGEEATVTIQCNTPNCNGVWVLQIAPAAMQRAELQACHPLAAAGGARPVAVLGAVPR